MASSPGMEPSDKDEQRAHYIERMHVLLHPVGSHGDVHPFVGLGRELRRRGHAVTVLTSEPFRAVVEAAGLAFAPTASAADFNATIGDPNLWHPTKCLGVLFRRDRLERGLRATVEAVTARFDPARPRETVLVAGSLGLAARVAHDKLGLPFATMHLQPGALASVVDPPEFATFRVRSWWPHWVRRGLYWAADRFLLDPLLAPPINAYRAELRLPPVRRVFGDWRHAPDRVLLAFPAWYGSAPDWPAQARHVGFIDYDQTGAAPMPPAVEAFLAAGPPPVVVTFGSAMTSARSAFAAAVEGIRLAGVRGLILARGGEQIPAPLPPTVFHAEYAPFSAIFGRCAAVVHHGGIGTTAQALAAGVPQVVRSMAFDQADNAARLVQLGVGRSLVPARFTPTALAGALAELLGSDGVRAASARLAGVRGAEAPGELAAADAVEALAAGRVWA